MGKKKQEAAPIPIPSSGGGGGGGVGLKEAGYREFAKTGGFSPEALSAIRARAVSPVRATYANALQDVERQRSLQGGYSPGFGTLRARMARQQGQSTAEAATNAEAGISEQVQRGRLAGLAGMQDPSSGGGGGGSGVPVPEEKKGFWGKLGGGLKKVGKIALPIALGMIPGAGPAASGLMKVGSAAAKAGAVSLASKR